MTGPEAPTRAQRSRRRRRRRRRHGTRRRMAGRTRRQEGRTRGCFPGSETEDRASWGVASRAAPGTLAEPQGGRGKRQPTVQRGQVGGGGGHRAKAPQDGLRAKGIPSHPSPRSDTLQDDRSELAFTPHHSDTPCPLVPTPPRLKPQTDQLRRWRRAPDTNTDRIVTRLGTEA